MLAVIRFFKSNKIVLTTTFATVIFLALTGCNTVSGVGRDIEALSGTKKDRCSCVPVVTTITTNPAQKPKKYLHG